MKKLIALLAVIGFVPSAYAAEGSDISWSGEYRLQYANTVNADLVEDTADTENQSWAQRTRLGVSGRAGEKMGFHGMFVHYSGWGANADQVPGGDDVTGTGDSVSNNEKNSIIVNGAYMTWMMNDMLSMKIGRGSATIANGYVVSANDYEEVAKAFDGAMISWDHEMVKVSGFGVLGAVGTDGQGDDFGRFWGVSADFKKLPAFIKMANLHYIMVKRDEGGYDIGGNNVDLDSEDSTRLGLTVGGDVAGVDYSVTYAQYSGETIDDSATPVKTDIDSSMMDLEVGYTLANVLGGTRFYAGHHTDTGTKSTATKNETYDGFHYETHATAGLLDIFEWGNLTYNRVGFSMSPMEDLSVAAEYLMFTQTEKDAAAGTDSNVTFAGGTEEATEDDLGTEIDLTVTKKYGNNFAISAAYRMFTPGDEFDNSTDNLEDGITQWYFEGKLTF